VKVDLRLEFIVTGKKFVCHVCIIADENKPTEHGLQLAMRGRLHLSWRTAPGKFAIH
jgi:hypothetical protein